MSVRAVSWARLLARRCYVGVLAYEHCSTGSAFLPCCSLFKNICAFDMVSLDGSATETMEGVMINFLDTVNYPGKDEEMQKLTLAVLKDNLLTASCVCQ